MSLRGCSSPKQSPLRRSWLIDESNPFKGRLLRRISMLAHLHPPRNDMEEITMDYDVIIVGGRVAGAILAARLGQLGHRVLLLEKASFPSDTLSTSFFRAPALRVFEKIGVLDEVKSAALPLRTLWNYIDGHVLSDPVEAAEEHLRFFLCERRLTLDWILFRRVKHERNVEVRLSAHVRELIWQDGRVTGVRWSESDGTAEACARVVVGADGFYSTLA